MIVGLYIFIIAITTKPVYKQMSGGIGYISTSGSGIVSTNNKYKVKSATARITLFDENNEVITSQFFYYSENTLVAYNFRITQSQPKRMDIEIYDAKINNKTDVVISLILISFGLGNGINIYIKNKDCFKRRNNE